MMRLGAIPVAIAVAGSLATAAPLGLRWLVTQTPVALDLPALSVEVRDHQGALLRPFTVADGRWRLGVDLESVDRKLIDMIIAYEDKRFYHHHGVDPAALIRASGQFILAGRIISGASTLTMQLARLQAEKNTRSAQAKVRQLLTAMALEQRLSKREILARYLTLAPYGGNVEGVRAATLAYFGKEPGRLTPAEAALLVALPQAPEARRPDRYPQVARAARDRVLRRMVKAGVLTHDTAMAAMGEKIPTARRRFPILAAHAARRVTHENPNRRVHRLTIDRPLQQRLEKLVSERLLSADRHVSLALIVADHKTGAIRAAIGSAGLLADERRGHVDMTRAVRSPGSTLKPLIYGLAFEEGFAHPASLVEDRPTEFRGYVPGNFDKAFRGTVTVREALAQSLNVPAVLLLDAVGPARLITRMRRAGMRPQLPSATPPGLAIGLGGVGVTLTDLVGLYAAIARGGDPIFLQMDLAAVDHRDRQSPVLSKRAAWQVADILTDTVRPVGPSGAKIAFKTGTSYGYRDAWAIGFDGRHVIGVWLGRPDGTPVAGLGGIKAAAPVMFEAFARLADQLVPLPSAPAGTLVATTGQLPPPLRRVHFPRVGIVQRDRGPQIAYPPNGARVDVGSAPDRQGQLVLKVRNGAPPFIWFVNGVPIARSDFGRPQSWRPDGPGFTAISVIDSKGEADRVSIYLE